MTPTPAETALWRALNVEPPRCDANGRVPTRESVDWQNSLHRFARSHPADRLAYFEGKVWERLPDYDLCITCESGAWIAHWYRSDRDDRFCHQAPTEPLARFHAAARAIHALGMITPEQLSEVEQCL